MKKTVIVCDRHNGEHDAVTSVWLRTPGMPRVRLDVCQDALRDIYGMNQNGRLALPAPKAPDGLRRRHNLGFGGMGGLTAKLLAHAKDYVKSARGRFTLDDMQASIAKSGIKHPRADKNLGRIMRELVESGVLQRHGVFGVFSAKGSAAPPAAKNGQDVRDILMKTIQAHPGIRTAYLPGMTDLTPQAIKRPVWELIDAGVIRQKGSRSASRLWTK